MNHRKHLNKLFKLGKKIMKQTNKKKKDDVLNDTNKTLTVRYLPDSFPELYIN